ncbi:GIY-YIG nuclease family protein [Gelidibacter mesophilus]|uniref:GIY-YIG nuclease family protein n=1 Tax=Gelidibacter mesophilus TaxID=169050 RepID=UPI0004285DDB|nr:GIY-YIG nuclease family protein [Gelidibacter mesophilus]
MIFTFGKYKDYEVDFVIENNRRYCEWIHKKIKNKEKHKELYSEIIQKLSQTEDNKSENPNVMAFGKFEGIKIDDFIFNEKSYCKWLLTKESFKLEYPATYKVLQQYYTVVHEENASKVIFLYLLTFYDKNYLKIGKTSNFIVKRIYSYTNCSTFYFNHIIDFKKSYVYMTNDIEIENRILKTFKDQRIDKKTERICTPIENIENYLKLQQKNNLNFYYSKKCLHSFLPFDNGKEFSQCINLKINEFVRFRKNYERRLKELSLFSDYDPIFNEIRQFKN